MVTTQLSREKVKELTAQGFGAKIAEIKALAASFRLDPRQGNHIRIRTVNGFICGPCPMRVHYVSAKAA
jgi:hypothetical protein